MTSNPTPRLSQSAVWSLKLKERSPIGKGNKAVFDTLALAEALAEGELEVTAI
jgi:hypothetical protein